MTFEQPIVAGSARRGHAWIRLVFALAVGAMLYRLGQFLVTGADAVQFPWELDYGEGIVWEQMRLMLEGRGYGPIDGLPAIVFHYPPIYHMATAGLAALFGTDALAAGRALSIASTLVIAFCAGALAYRAVRGDVGSRPALACGIVAGLSLFSFGPVLQWAMLMRVDMLSIAFSFAGVLAAMAALKRSPLIVISGLLFVAAIYTKQTSIVAPAAVFLTYLFLRPRLAWMLAGTCLVAGLAVLFALQAATDGGFARHIFLYNVNRFQAGRLLALLVMTVAHLLFAIALIIGIGARLREKWTAYRYAGSLAALRERLLAAPGDTAFLMLMVYAVLASFMTLTIAKSGSNVNYFIECMAVLSVLLGIAVRDAANFAFGSGPRKSGGLLTSPDFLPLLIAAQAVMADAPAIDFNPASPRNTERAELLQMIRNAHKPVSSDDMVMLVRAGKPVEWEPAIFAELAETGAWDERPFVEHVRRGEFAFFATDAKRGEYMFDSRYSRAVADAIDATYPVKRKFGGQILHLPRAPAPAKP